MGMFDDVEINCPHCGELGLYQTKVLGRCSLDVFRLNDLIFEEAFSNCTFQLKEGCMKCGKDIIIIINDSKIVGTTTEPPLFREYLWGEVKNEKRFS